MAEKYEICEPCRGDDCDLCEDTWSSGKDEHFCICECGTDDDDLLDNSHDDIWNKYRDLYEEHDDDKYYD